MKKKKDKLYDMAIIILTVLSIVGIICLIKIAIYKLNKDRCYNLPLNEFYEDKSCLKYVEELDD